jgi:hypothetical protein
MKLLGPNVSGIVSSRKAMKMPMFNNRAFSVLPRVRGNLLASGAFRGSRILAKYHGLKTGKVGSR